jgi:hypothetical protein
MEQHVLGSNAGKQQSKAATDFQSAPVFKNEQHLNMD